MLVVTAVFVVALMSGLTEEVAEAGGVMRVDQAVNAALGAWREPALVVTFLWISFSGQGPRSWWSR